MAYIYEIRNLVNNKIYIGSTNNYNRRKSKHISELKHNKHGNKYLQNAWNKHGEDNFQFKILLEVDDTYQFIIEQIYLIALDPFGKNGYNIRTDVTDPSKRKPVERMCFLCGKEFLSYKRVEYYCPECMGTDDDYEIFNPSPYKWKIIGSDNDYIYEEEMRVIEREMLGLDSDFVCEEEIHKSERKMFDCLLRNFIQLEKQI